MKKHLVAVTAVVALLSALAPAADEPATKPADEEKPASAADNLAIAEAVAPSLVRVEYTLQHDKGESPELDVGLLPLSPFSHRYPRYGAEAVISQERPLENPGFLLSPTRVVCPDIMVHRRFIKDVAVRFGQQVVKAKPAGFAKAHNALFLDLAEPLKDAKPLAFDTKAKRPYMVVTYWRVNGAWTTKVEALGMAVSATEYGRKFRAAPSCCLIVDKKGLPVGMSMKHELPIDDSWKGSPLKWQGCTAKEVESLLADIETRSASSLPRVALSFRSPKKRPGFDRYSTREEEKTERNVLGVLMDKQTILVLASLKPKVTARLQRILVHPAEGKAVAAKFQHSLKDYGCFVAKLEKPLDGAVKLSMKKITDYRDMMLPAAQIKLQGEKRVAYYVRSRIRSYDIGWRRKTFPNVATRRGNLYLFDPSGDLLALPVMRRPKAAIGRDWRSGSSRLTPAAHLKELFADLAENADPSNVPLTEAEENRLAWLGVVMQRLNKELARANNVSDQTRDGQTGGLISYVYPGSPADKAGIKVGHILLRLHVKDRPKPIEVQLGQYGFGDRPFPWDRFDELPEQYYDQIPQPWPPAENAFTRALTDLGFGKNYRAEFFADGKVFRKEFTVVASPTHYNSAKRHKDKNLGLTVADLTYEVRRYFQKKPGEPGLILAKIEPGSKASVSGLKPYEIITHVNDKPVRNVADFEKLIAGQSELRLAVKRMTRGRVVKIKMAGRKVPTTGAATGAVAPAP